MMYKRILFTLFLPVWQVLDLVLPKNSYLWAFSTHHIHTARFIENQRAVFEFLKSNASIRKIIFYRGTAPDFVIEDAHNYEIVRYGSLRSLLILARCKVVFVTHSLSMDFSLRWEGSEFSVVKVSMKNRLVVNLWHGIPIKRLLYAANSETRLHTDRVPFRRFERSHYGGLIASSDIDSYAMAAMFYPICFQQIWVTGLPRNDFLLLEHCKLPNYIRDSIEQIRARCRGKRLVLYAPTYRQTKVSSTARYYQFSDSEIAELRSLLLETDAVLGYRPHYFLNSSQYFNLDKYIDNDLILDFSQTLVPELSAAARECDILITDYSSVFIETLYLRKPAICFAYDLEHYMAEQDGLLYDMSLIFPGRLCRSFSEVIAALRVILSTPDSSINPDIDRTQKIFFKHRDCDNSKRVITRVVQEIGIELPDRVEFS